jgi:competence protein ComEC
MKKGWIGVFLAALLLSGCSYAMKPVSSLPAADTASAERTPGMPQEPVPSSTVTAGGMTVHFIDVGHGDCILIQAGKENMLIDTGNVPYYGEVIEYLRKHGVRELDKVLITHPHIDHIGGLADIIRAFPIKELIMTETTADNPGYAAAIDAIDQNGLAVTHPRVGDRFRLSGAVLTVLAPSQGTYKDMNNTSIVTRLTYGETSFLLTGDASAVSEQEMLANEPELTLRSTLLKCGHHGGSSSTTQDFLAAVQPEYAVISCSKSTKGQFPYPAVLKRLDDMDVSVLRTDQLGTIVVHSDGMMLEILL